MSWWSDIFSLGRFQPTDEQVQVFKSYVFVYESLRNEYIDAMGSGGAGGIIPGAGSLQKLGALSRVSGFDEERRSIEHAFYFAENDQAVITAITDMEALIDASRASFGVNARGELSPDLGGEQYRVNEYDSGGNLVKGAPDVRADLIADADTVIPPLTWGLGALVVAGAIGLGIYAAHRAGLLKVPKVVP